MAACKWFVIPGNRIKRYIGNGKGRCCLYHGKYWHGNWFSRRLKNRKIRLNANKILRRKDVDLDSVTFPTRERHLGRW